MADSTYVIDPYALASGTAYLWDDGTGIDSISIIGADYIAIGPYTPLWIDLSTTTSPAWGSQPFAMVHFLDFSGGATPVHRDLWIYGVIERVFSGQGSDNISGNAEANLIQGDPSDVAGGGDTIYGKGGADTLLGCGGSDVVYQSGDIGALMYGDWDPYSRDGGNFAAGDDIVGGGSGDDTIYGGSGANTLNGGWGIDLVDYGGFYDDLGYTGYWLTLDLEAQTATVTGWDFYTGDSWVEAHDTLDMIEIVQGTQEADVMVGRTSFYVEETHINTLYGRGGNDSLAGGGWADRLYGGEGDDSLDGGGNLNGTGGPRDILWGGTGNDSYHVVDARTQVAEGFGEGYDQILASVSFDLSVNVEALTLEDVTAARTSTGNALGNRITGNSFDNNLAGLGGQDSLYGGDGNDSLDGGSGNDLADGGAGDDLLTGNLGADTVDGGAGADVATGDDGNDVLYGAGGGDQLYGGAGRDRLFGGSENDVLVGGDEADTLQGGTGKDQLTGMAGADRFVYASAAEAGRGLTRDVITDFQSGFDKLDLHLLQPGQSFIGRAAFGHVAGEIRWGFLAGAPVSTVVLSGDIDGDARVDWQIELANLSSIHRSDLLI